MNFDLTKDVVLFVLSVWGAGLATFNYFHGISKDKRQARIFFDYEYRIDDVIGEQPKLLVSRVVNTGIRPVVVTGIDLCCRDNVIGGIDGYTDQDGFIPGENSNFPKELGQGHEARASFEFYDIQRSLKHLGEKGRVSLTVKSQLSTGEVICSEPVIFDVEKRRFPFAIAFDQ